MSNSITITWNVSDVKGVAQDMEINLTDDEAREVLRRLKVNHDASVGINWDVIEDTIAVYKDSYRIGDMDLS